jgi:hypothetical protein
MRTKILMLIAATGLLASATVPAAARSGGAYGVWEVPQPEGVARWRKSPVCPLVSGLPAPEGEFILERISDIARAAGVPLAGEHCRANLYILVTRQPRELLEAMAKRNRAFTFSSATPFVVDEFIRSTRPVRVWYDTAVEDRWGLIPTDAHAGVQDVPVVPTLVSRLAPAVQYGFLRVFVVVDATQLRGASRGQVADYVGMVGLVKLASGPHFSDAQGILQLFDRNPSAAPAGLTDADRALLKSLYVK